MDGFFNGGDLTINEEYLQRFNDNCDRVYESATKGKAVIEDMMDTCDGIVDFGGLREEVEASYTKACRILRYKDAMNQYVRDVLAFDEELAQKFADLRAADADNDNVEWKAINADLLNRSSTISNTWVTAQLQNATNTIDAGNIINLSAPTLSNYVTDTVISESSGREQIRNGLGIVGQLTQQAVYQAEIAALNNNVMILNGMKTPTDKKVVQGLLMGNYEVLLEVNPSQLSTEGKAAVNTYFTEIEKNKCTVQMKAIADILVTEPEGLAGAKTSLTPKEITSMSDIRLTGVINSQASTDAKQIQAMNENRLAYIQMIEELDSHNGRTTWGMLDVDSLLISSIVSSQFTIHGISVDSWKSNQTLNTSVILPGLQADNAGNVKMQIWTELNNIRELRAEIEQNVIDKITNADMSNNADLQFMADMFIYSVENNKTKFLDAWIKAVGVMNTAELVEEMGVEEELKVYNISTCLDWGNCEKLLDRIDKKKNPSEYNLLYRLASISSTFRYEDNTFSHNLVNIEPYYEARIVDGELVIEAKMDGAIVTGDNKNQYRLFKFDTNYSQDFQKKLKDFGIDQEMFLSMVLRAEKPDDIGMLYDLYNEDYKKVFRDNFDVFDQKISDSFKLELERYSSHLLNNDHEKFCQFTNAILYESDDRNYYTGYDFTKYLECLSKYANKDFLINRELMIAAVYGSDLSQEELLGWQDVMREKMQAYGTWNYMSDNFIQHNPLELEKLVYYQVDDIEYMERNGVLTIPFTCASRVIGTDNSIKSQDASGSFDINVIFNPFHLASSLDCSKMLEAERELQKDIEMEVFYTSMAALSCFNPLLASSCSFAVDILTRDTYGGIKDGASTVSGLNNKYLNNVGLSKVVGTKDVAAHTLRLFNYLSSDKVDKIAKENICKLFGAGIKQKDGEDYEIIGSTICDPLLINNLKKCDENGLLSFERYKGYKYKDIMSIIGNGLTAEEQAYCMKILSGGDAIRIMDMDPEKLDKCIDALNDYFGDDKIVQDVLNPY